MLSKTLALTSWIWGKKAWLSAGLAALLFASLAWIYVQGLRLDGVRAEAARQIQAERAAHNATRSELATALTEAARWADVAKLAQAATISMRATAQAAIEREARAHADASERKQILSAAKPRARTVAEIKEVVDDDTRHRAADRLNRPW